jgi:hypothetical protein
MAVVAAPDGAAALRAMSIAEAGARRQRSGQLDQE